MMIRVFYGLLLILFPSLLLIPNSQAEKRHGPTHLVVGGG